MVHVIQTGEDPWDEPVDEIMTWLGGWRPEVFDLDAVKATFDR